MRHLRYLILLFILYTPALAHRVNIFAYVEGKRIITKGYYSDGSPVRQGEVIVYDDQGKRLLSGKTDDEGRFSFSIPKRTDLKLVLKAGMGHQAETRIKKADLPEVKTRPEPKRQTGRLKESQKISEDEIRRIVEEVIDEKLHPLFELIGRQQKRQVSVTEVIGGIGYIVGIMGIIMFLRSRKKRA